MKKLRFLFLAVVSIVLMGFDQSEMENQAPALAERIAEENYRDFILRIINDSNAARFNFTRGDKDLALGKLIPENRLVIDKNLNISVEAPTQWIAPVYQSGEVKNVIVIWEPSEGKYEIAGTGSSYWLTDGVSQLEDDEYYLHSRPFEFDFAYSSSKNRVRPMGDSSTKYFNENGLDPEGVTKTEFIAFVQQHLKSNFHDEFNGESESRLPYLFGGMGVILFIGGLIFLKRQKRSMNG
ncbi:hypothetical protein [Mesobacillus subterraneus]|uniref:Uncharacterized protein n=1 Tax=Mesobacillus subterraneus TaxID=285983 RepID=A0A427TWF6_9BACI|nr:hypothetical protein [Mesobacillus subterraneus]RSD28742.1 hypothetical protein EJA10_03980 [Mesobacillus subterraneus]